MGLEQCSTHCNETLQPHSPTHASCIELICLLLASSQLLADMHQEKQLHVEHCSDACKKWLCGLETFLQNRQGHLKRVDRVVTACNLALEQRPQRLKVLSSASWAAVSSAHICLPTISWSSRWPHGAGPAMVIRPTWHLSNLASKELFRMLTFQTCIWYQDRFSALALATSATGSLVRLDSLSQKNLLVCRPHPPASSASSEWFGLPVKQVIQKRLRCIWLQH